MSIGTTRLKMVLAAAETTGELLNPEDKLWSQNHLCDFSDRACNSRRTYCRLYWKLACAGYHSLSGESLHYMIEILRELWFFGVS